jgi:putative cell wall-binding protein
MFKDRISKRGRWIASVGLATSAVFGAGFLFSPAEAQTPTVTRVNGADRYDTAARLSHDTFPENVNVAFVATGEAFPDALAGSAAAGKLGGPVLLVQKDSIPTTTANELTRLHPKNIILLGGTGAVSGSVETDLAPFTSGSVTREAGNDRYETAADISASTFTDPDVDVAYVTTGENFPDALSAGAAAFKEGPGPVLLVQKGSIPTATANELDRLNIKKVVVVGGTQAVNASVQDQLDQYSQDPVARRFGPTRYDTSVVVSSSVFPAFSDGAGTVYLATGTNFPDALAGGAAGAKVGGPVLLVQSNCIPQGTKDELTRLNPKSIVLLGGTGALGNGVQALTVCTAGGNTTFGSDFGIPTTGGSTLGDLGTDFSIPTAGGFPTGG